MNISRILELTFKLTNTQHGKYGSMVIRSETPLRALWQPWISLCLDQLELDLLSVVSHAVLSWKNFSVASIVKATDLGVLGPISELGRLETLILETIFGDAKTNTFCCLLYCKICLKEFGVAKGLYCLCPFASKAKVIWGHWGAALSIVRCFRKMPSWNWTSL